MAVFQFTAIRPQALSSARVRANILNVLKEEQRNATVLMNQTIATWEGDRPTMKGKIAFAGGHVMMSVKPDGNPFGIQKWIWLDEGTSVRYATMSRNWKSKTRPGRIRSGHGQGFVAFVSRRVPRPGIQPRNWSSTINQIMGRAFDRRIQDAITRGLRGAP